MFNIVKPKPWELISSKPIDEKVYHDRRKILKQLGLVTAGILSSPLLFSSCQSKPGEKSSTQGGAIEIVGENRFHFEGMEEWYPAEPNSKYILDRPLTSEHDATHYNNFYEFISPNDSNIYNAFKYVDKFDNRDWKIEVGGLAENTGTFWLEEIIKKMGLEERTYRFRCVERWSMAVPWTGFPLSKLIRFLDPKSGATHVRMVTYSNQDQMPGIKSQPWYPWPYFEGLRMDEAMNELAFLATGIFGKPLPKQNGAPIRLVVPWKYGYKNTKSIVRIEFVDHEPETFWHKVSPSEYGFISNVDPEKPHPRWSQKFERMIPDGEPRPTLKYNGYGEFVARLYQS